MKGHEMIIKKIDPCVVQGSFKYLHFSRVSSDNVTNFALEEEKQINRLFVMKTPQDEKVPHISTHRR